MYRSIFLDLNEAIHLLARKFSETHNLDAVSAISLAQRQLLLALFDGAVSSEGVWWSLRDLPDPDAPPIPQEPDEWRPIRAGYWSHRRYEPLVWHDDGRGFPGFIPDRPPRDYVEDGTYVLDIAIVNWENNRIRLLMPDRDDGHCQISDEDEGFYSIRIRRSDLETNFGLVEADLRNIVDQSVNTSTPPLPPDPDVAVTKKKTKPDVVKTAVESWLDIQLQTLGKDWINARSHIALARQYMRQDKPNGSEGHARKLISEWRRKCGLLRGKRAV
jgi:hypothetical protein